MNTPPPPPRPLGAVTDPLDVALGARIDAARRERNLSVSALARLTGLHRQTIDRSIKGERTLDFGQFDKIATALGGIHEDLVRDIWAA